MLKWQGDYTVPRLRAKLANKYLIHPDVEPEYAEVYRPDLSLSTILRKDNAITLATTRPELGVGDTLARTAGSWLGQSRSGSSLLSLDQTRRPSLASSLGGSDSRRSSTQFRTLRRMSSVPSLGVRSAERAPSTLQSMPMGIPGSEERPKARTPTLQVPPSVPSSPTSDAKLSEKEQQALLASKRLWTYAGGSELLVKTQLVILRDEDPKAANSVLLQKLSKAPIVAMVNQLKLGAKIDWRNPDWDGATLLIKSLRTDSLPIAMYCLSVGADPQTVDDSGRGMIHWAAMGGNPEIMGYLLENYPDVDVNMPDSGGDTALHLAAFNGHLPVVRLLVAASADHMATNAGGHSAFDLAQAARAWHVASYLAETRQHDEDRASKEIIQIKDLLRPCNLARADEVRRAAVQ